METSYKADEPGQCVSTALRGQRGIVDILRAARCEGESPQGKADEPGQCASTALRGQRSLAGILRAERDSDKKSRLNQLDSTTP